MPTYEYTCQNCKKEFSTIMSFAEHEESKVNCPDCKSEDVKQMMSTFMTKTSKKS